MNTYSSKKMREIAIPMGIYYIFQEKKTLFFFFLIIIIIFFQKRKRKPKPQPPFTAMGGRPATGLQNFFFIVFL
jgi:hypothetical protein